MHGGNRHPQVAIGGGAQVIDFGGADLRLDGGLGNAAVGGADQRELLAEGQEKDDPAIFILQRKCVLTAVKARHDDVAAAHELNTGFFGQFGNGGDDLRHPGASGIDDAQRGDLDFFTATQIADPGAPEITIPPGTEKAMAVEDMGAALTGVNQVGDDQTGVVDLDIGVGEALLEIRPQRLAEGLFSQIDGGGTGQVTTGQPVVKRQAQTQHPDRTQGWGMRQDKGHRSGEMARGTQ